MGIAAWNNGFGISLFQKRVQQPRLANPSTQGSMSRVVVKIHGLRIVVGGMEKWKVEVLLYRCEMKKAVRNGPHEHLYSMMKTHVPLEGPVQQSQVTSGY